MSCCGEPKGTDDAPTNGATRQVAGTISTQPGFHPGLEKPQTFHQPSLSPPLQAHANTFATNGFQEAQFQQQMLQHQSSLNDFGALQMQQGAVPGGLPPGAGFANVMQTYNGSTFNVANGFSMANQPLARPSSHSPGLSLSTLPTQYTGTPNKGAPDEGKMSISIDFGASQRLPISKFLNELILVDRYDFLWCSTFFFLQNVQTHVHVANAMIRLMGRRVSLGAMSSKF